MPPAAEAPASVVDTIALARSHRLTNDDAACMEPGPSSPRVASHAIPGATPGGSSRMVNVHQAKTQLSRLIDAAHAGETIVLAKAGKPWARLVPLEPPAPQRIPGRLRQHGPLGDPNALLEPLDPVELAAWDCSPLVSEASQP